MHMYGGERACACKDDAVGNGNQQPDRSRTRNYFLSVTCDVRTKTNFTLYRAPPHGGGGQLRLYHLLHRHPPDSNSRTRELCIIHRDEEEVSPPSRTGW